MKVNPYLSFNGKCEEAFNLYKEVLGGELVAMMRFGESPMADQGTPELKDTIMHARLIFDGNVLMGSDSPPEYFQPPQGTYVSVSVDTTTEAERIYNGLLDGASIRMEIQETFWATRFAMLIDRFGTPWMINCEKSM
jgi:PhnB protein